MDSVMQIMSKLNKTYLIASICFFSHSLASATENHLNFFDVNRNAIEIYEKNNIVRVIYSGKQLSVDSKAKKMLSKMDSIAIIGGKSFSIDTTQFFWSFIRIPSKHSMGIGYCGAGFEDFISLFKINKKSLTFDKFQVQSCLDNFSIGVDSISGVKANVLISPENNNIEISQDFFKEDKAISKKIRLKATTSKIKTELLKSE